MNDNALVLDWTMDRFGPFKAELTGAGFHFEKKADSEAIGVTVPLERLDEFAALCQAHLNTPCNYVDVQFRQERKTALIFRQRVWMITNSAENQAAKTWAIAQGLPPEQADWGVSF